MKKYIFYAVCMLIAACVASCNSDSEPTSTIPQGTCYDFATLASTNDAGSTFTLQQSENSPLVTYSCSVPFAKVKDVKVGDRLIIMYVPTGGKPYVSGPITLYGYRVLDSTDQNLVITSAKQTSNWASSTVNPSIFDMTGVYVNLQAQVACMSAEKPKKLYLAADEETVDNEYPTLHLIYMPATEGFNQTTIYSSFDVSDLWEKDSCKGIVINYHGINGPATKRFLKNAGGITPRPDID